ncbi:MAG: lysophospholipid acyltransferase family protein [Planctomycetota bacterium]
MITRLRFCAYFLLGWALILLGWCFFRTACRGRVQGQPPKPGYILIANHSSHFDWIILLGHFVLGFRQRPTFVAAQEVRKRFWGRAACAAAGVVILDRQRPTAEFFKKLDEILEAGGSIAIFPEGTRSLSGRINGGRPGIAYLWDRTQVPILPVGIEGTHRILPKGGRVPRPRMARVRIGTPIDWQEGFRELSRQELACMLMERVAGLAGQVYRPGVR